jgi:hypothetical protein
VNGKAGTPSLLCSIRSVTRANLMAPFIPFRSIFDKRFQVLVRVVGIFSLLQENGFSLPCSGIILEELPWCNKSDKYFN